MIDDQGSKKHNSNLSIIRDKYSKNHYVNPSVSCTRLSTARRKSLNPPEISCERKKSFDAQSDGAATSLLLAFKEKYAQGLQNDETEKVWSESISPEIGSPNSPKYESPRVSVSQRIRSSLSDNKSPSSEITQRAEVAKVQLEDAANDSVTTQVPPILDDFKVSSLNDLFSRVWLKESSK